MKESTDEETELINEILSINKEEQKKVIEEFLAKVQKVNKIKLKTAINRNILFVGRTRSGKSTALRILKDPSHLASAGSIYSETMDPNFYSFTVETEIITTPVATIEVPSPVEQHPQNTINYNIHILDTPGLFEVKTRTEDIRDNEVIKKLILKCVEYEVTRIHCIFFVCSFTAGVNKEDLEAFGEFLKLFSGAEGTIAMLITNAERFTPERKQFIIKEILQHPALSAFVQTIENKFFFTGAGSMVDYDSGRKQSVQEDIINVMAMRKTLYDHIFKSEKYCQLTSLDYYAEQQHLVTRLQEKILEMQSLLDSRDLLLSDREKIMDEYSQMMTQLERMKGFVCTSIGIQTYQQIFDNDHRKKGEKSY